MVSKEQKIINNLKKQEVRTPISEEMYIPNHSGDHSKGRTYTTPTTDYEIANKKYVDDQIAAITSAPSRTVYQFGALNITSNAGSTTALKLIDRVTMGNSGQGIPIMCETSGTIDKLNMNFDLTGLSGFAWKVQILVNGSVQYTSATITSSGGNKMVEVNPNVSVNEDDLIRIRQSNSTGTQSVTMTNCVGCFRVTED